MKTEQALHRLHVHQQAILDHFAAGVALLDLDPETARKPLTAARWEAVRLMRAYQLFKHVEIFDPAICSGSPARAAAGRRMKAACIAAAEAFRVHVALGGTRDIAAGWDAYRAAALAMAERVRSHILAERVQVMQLLAGCERTRAVAGRPCGGGVPPLRAGLTDFGTLRAASHATGAGQGR